MNPTRTCLVCDGDGVVVVKPVGRPRLDGTGRLRWRWCPRCEARGWVYAGRGRPAAEAAASASVGFAVRRVARLERGREFYRRWRDGETHPAIGASCDPPISRERVRQLIYEATPSWEVALTHQLGAARGRLRAFVRSGTIPVERDCWVCGTTTTTASATAASPTCELHRDRPETAHISNALRLVCDINGRRELHRRAPSVRPVLGLAGTNAGQRWVVPGSNVDRVIVEAVENDWPLLDHLPVEVVDRVRARIAVRCAP